ncbi:MAG: hypothetical protein R3E54_16390 [Halioglobus sp.]
MLKLIYLARRRPGFTFDEFVRRWRRHGALGMQQTFWRHALAYVQAEPVRLPAVADAAAEFDAVACFITDDDMFTDMDDDDIAGSASMAADELETFSGPIADVSLWVREERIQPGELGGFTAFGFFADAGVAREAATRAGATGGFNRVTLNLRDDTALGPQANTLPYRAVVELSASGSLQLAAALDQQEGQLLADAQVRLITREAVFWDRL